MTRRDAIAAAAIFLLVLGLGLAFSQPSLGKMAATGVKPKRETRPARRFPRAHRHKTVKRCLESDGKTWRRGACQ